ncbi:MAG: hypothetical protein PUD16_12925 [bacterium]|nr:hypothetical protein [bacterium]
MKQIFKGTGQTLWRSRAHAAWFRLCAVCLSLYIGYITYLAHSRMFLGRMATGMSLMAYLAVSAGVYGILDYLINGLFKDQPKAKPERDHMDWRVFAIAFAAAMGIFACAFAACYPGAVNYDISNQWHQAHSGEYNNWHPVFHTLMMTLVTRVYDSYPLLVLLQITVFAALMAWLTAVLHKHGVPAWLALLVHVAVAASLPVRNTLMYPGKDSAMTIGVLAVTIQLIEILFTRGEWLRKRWRAVLMGVLLGSITLLRINALLWTAPLLLCVFFAYRRIRLNAALAACVAAAFMAVIQGPVYGALDVVYPDNVKEEAVGLPMTILCDIRRTEPSKLDSATIAFMARLAPDRDWREVYQLHNYNSIKFTFPREYIKNMPLRDILSMSFRSAYRAPRTAFKAFNGLTDLVWDVTGKEEGFQSVRNSGDIEEIQPSSSRISQLGSRLLRVIDGVMSFPPIRYLTRNIGVQFVLLLLVTLWALRRHGCGVLMMALPTLCYNLGTMFLLCGNDARFFQFSMTVSMAMMLAMMYLPREEMHKCR